MCQLYLDLDEIDRVFAHRWLWSSAAPQSRRVPPQRLSGRRPAFRSPTRFATWSSSAPARRPDGPIRLLTHLRYAGYIFNPVSFYYCYAADGSDAHGHRRGDHEYAMEGTPRVRAAAGYAALRRGSAWEWEFAKTFHVSPFVGMQREYAWRFTAPGDDLRVQMDVLRDGERELEAYLDLRRRPITRSESRARAVALSADDRAGHRRNPLAGAATLAQAHAGTRPPAAASRCSVSSSIASSDFISAAGAHRSMAARPAARGNSPACNAVDCNSVTLRAASSSGARATRTRPCASRCSIRRSTVRSRPTAVWAQAAPTWTVSGGAAQPG